MSVSLKLRDGGEAYALAELWEPVDLASAFDVVATAPNGVKKLRELILSLAIQGRLVPQNSADESGASLLERIRLERGERLELAGKREEIDLKAKVKVGQALLPRGWVWASLGEVTTIIRGITFPASEKTNQSSPTRIACLRTTNVQDQIEWDDLLFVDRSFVSRDEQLVKLLDIVMSMANSRELVGKVALIERVSVPEAAIGGFLAVLRPTFIDPRFLMLFLRTTEVRSQLIDSSSQTTNIANISLGKLRPLPFPLPPLEEQHCIVSRANALMKLCDSMEENGRLEAEQHAGLTSALFDSLVASESPQALAENWQRISEHFDLLLDRPEAVDALEKTILELAVRGLLIQQASDGESASDLLDRCSRQRKAYCVENRMTQSQTDPIDRTTPPFSVPLSWLWVRLGSLFLAITDGDHQAPPKSTQGVPFLTIGNISAGSIRFDGCRFVPKDYFDSIAEHRRPRAGDILYTVVGATYGRPVLVDTEQPFCVQRHIAMLKPTAAMERSFLLLLLQSPFIYKQASASITGTAQPTVGLTSLRNFSVPLPPIAEQHGIVARVCELRELCSRLRERLKARTAIQAQLAETVSTSVV